MVLILITSKVVVKRESARMDSPRHDLRRLNTGHNNMCRFVHSDDPIYMEVSAVIAECYDSILKPQHIDCEILYDCPLEWVRHFVTALVSLTRPQTA
jgi:hypothetical protein